MQKTWKAGDVIIVDGVERTVARSEYSTFVVVRHWTRWERARGQVRGRWASLRFSVQSWKQDTRLRWMRWKFRNDPYIKALKRFGRE